MKSTGALVFGGGLVLTGLIIGLSATFDTIDNANQLLARWQAALRGIEERPENGLEDTSSLLTFDGKVRVDFVSTVHRRP